MMDQFLSSVCVCVGLDSESVFFLICDKHIWSTIFGQVDSCSMGKCVYFLAGTCKHASILAEDYLQKHEV